MIEIQSKISSWAVTVTSAIIFFGVVLLAPLVSDAPGLLQFGSIIVTALMSFGLYKLLSNLIVSLFSKFQWIRKLLLGNAFLEGTWVGHWVHDGKNVFTIETIKQESGETSINGRQIGEDGKTQADWSSESTFVDLRKERLIYVYSCDVYRTNHQQNGIGVFKMIKENENIPPNVLDGYAVDMIDGDKDPNREYKIDDGIMSTEEALEKAKVIFNV